MSTTNRNGEMVRADTEMEKTTNAYQPNEVMAGVLFQFRSKISPTLRKRIFGTAGVGAALSFPRYFDENNRQTSLAESARKLCS